MSDVDPMAKFKPVQLENSITDMLQLLFSKDDIETKTRIQNPSAIAGLITKAGHLEDIGLVKSAKRLKGLLQTRLECNVSEKGLGRSEFVDAFKSSNQMVSPDLSLSDRLFTDLKKE